MIFSLSYSTEFDLNKSGNFGAVICGQTETDNCSFFETCQNLLRN